MCAERVNSSQIRMFPSHRFERLHVVKDIGNLHFSSINGEFCSQIIFIIKVDMASLLVNLDCFSAGLLG